MSEETRTRRGHNPQAFDHRQPFQTADRLQDVRADAITSADQTRGYHLVRSHRRPGQVSGVQAMSAVRRAGLEDLMREQVTRALATDGLAATPGDVHVRSDPLETAVEAVGDAPAARDAPILEAEPDRCEDDIDRRRRGRCQPGARAPGPSTLRSGAWMRSGPGCATRGAHAGARCGLARCHCKKALQHGVVVIGLDQRPKK